jgi:hypothetical protein
MPGLNPATVEDLQRSGLDDSTIEAAGIIDGGIDPTVADLLRERYKVTGYKLPYFGADRKQTKHYRVKVLESLNGHTPPKYIQPKSSGNHLYIPPTLHALAPKWKSDYNLPLFITEGEKKALAAVQAGIACVAVGGVFSWRTHIHTLERGVLRVEDKASKAIVHLDDRGEKAYRMEVAPELDEIYWRGREVYLIFDSDAESNTEVQRACFEFANWLDDRGAIPKQLSLAGSVPAGDLERAGFDPNAKLGLDDVLLLRPAFSEDLKDPHWRDDNGFRPLPSDPYAWVTDQLNDGRANRATQERVSTFAINWLDANGTRFMGEDGTYYYFDESTRVLHDFRAGPNLATLRETSFGHLLVEQLGIDPADSSTLGRLVGRFPLGAPVISPYRVIAHSPLHPDTIYYQVSDADVIKIDAEGLDLISNGDDDILFHQGSVKPLDLDAFVEAADAWERPKTPLWYQALSTLNIEPMGELTRDETLKLLACTFYMSPWLQRWRGMMLPLEIAVAEPNSGKSFTYNVRKGILTGKTSLSGLPNDFKDWVAAVGAAPALWVCDNLGNVRSEYWHRLNDELARLITDPSPSVELRKLYTTATTFRVPISSAFAITTVRNPFTAPDVLQRSLVYHLSAIPVGDRDPDWVTDRMNARPQWVAEHVNLLHLFFKRVEKHWQPNFKSGYRLVHFEQALLHMGKVLGWDMSDVVKKLAGVVAATVAEYDPIIEALSTFFDEWSEKHSRRKVFYKDIINWVDADADERYKALRQFANPVVLGKYVQAHKYDIEQACGVEIEKTANVTTITIL